MVQKLEVSLASVYGRHSFYGTYRSASSSRQQRRQHLGLLQVQGYWALGSDGGGGR